jgi:DNA-binding XRE family transcriptional regulator
MDRLKFDRFAFLQAVERRRMQEGLSKRGLAREVGVAPTCIVEMATRLRGPSIDLVVTLLAWLGDDIRMYAERR